MIYFFREKFLGKLSFYLGSYKLVPNTLSPKEGPPGHDHSVCTHSFNALNAVPHSHSVCLVSPLRAPLFHHFWTVNLLSSAWVGRDTHLIRWSGEGNLQIDQWLMVNIGKENTETYNSVTGILKHGFHNNTVYQ